MSIYASHDVTALLESVANHSERGLFACMVPHRGSAYDSGQFLVVGRATNGWGARHTQFTLAALRDPVERARLAEASAQYHHPLDWVNEYSRWSAFWRVARGVAAGVGATEGAGSAWPERLAWSNIYKIAPANRGNPSDALADAQLAPGAALLGHEIATLSPRWVLFLVGCGAQDDWF